MERKTFNICFFVKKSKPMKNGKYPLFLRLTVNGKRWESSLKVGVSSENWDTKKEKVIGNGSDLLTINETIESTRYRLHKIKLSLEDEGKTLTLGLIRDRFIDKESNSRTIIKLFEDHNIECEQKIGVQITEATCGRYKTCMKHVKAFLKKEYKSDDLPVSEIDRRFYERFEYFLKTEKSCSHNTSIKYIRNFNKITRIAVEKNWLTKSPYKDMGFRLEEIDKPYLSQIELASLATKKISIKRLDVIRDLFVFCCYTGLAFSDIKELTSDNIQIGIDNRKWILKKRHKTNIISKIPLFEIPENILNKYKNSPGIQDSEKVLPVPSNQKMNAYLKELACICKIEKNLTTHSARRTFATTIMLQNGVSMEAVSGMLGHTSLFMTRKYAKIDEYYIAIEAEKVRSKCNSIG